MFSYVFGLNFATAHYYLMKMRRFTLPKMKNVFEIVHADKFLKASRIFCHCDLQVSLKLRELFQILASIAMKILND